jgi:signal transduction histidine kinase
MILFANKQALNLLNLKETDVVGKKTEEIMKRNDLFKYLATEKNNIPFKIVVENRENYFTKETIDITDEDGTPTGYVIVVKNVTSFKELDVAKTNFIATISHELKTPLASSDFSLKLLEDERVGILNADQKELVQNIKNDNQRLLRILSELLDISQVESGKIQLNLQPASPKKLVQKAIESTANAAKSKHINIRTNITTEKKIMADEDKTTWVLNNFISNAIKHSSDNGNIIIDVKENTSHVSFHVKDEGIGIDKKYLPRVFDRFFKVPGQQGGTGLGLAISKEFIEAMDGKIYATSDPGKGSTFSFDLKKA